MERIRAEFFIYQNMVAGTEITDDFDVMNWFQIQKMQFPMLTRFAYIICSITPSKNENKRDFSLAGIYNSLRRANLSVDEKQIGEHFNIDIGTARCSIDACK